MSPLIEDGQRAPDGGRQCVMVLHTWAKLYVCVSRIGARIHHALAFTLSIWFVAHANVCSINRSTINNVLSVECLRIRTLARPEQNMLDPRPHISRTHDDHHITVHSHTQTQVRAAYIHTDIRYMIYVFYIESIACNWSKNTHNTHTY